MTLSVRSSSRKGHRVHLSLIHQGHLETLCELKNAHYLMLHTGIIDAQLLAWLPRGAGVINVARGAHLVEEDLLSALDSGQVRVIIMPDTAPCLMPEHKWHSLTTTVYLNLSRSSCRRTAHRTQAVDHARVWGLVEVCLLDPPTYPPSSEPL